MFVACDFCLHCLRRAVDFLARQSNRQFNCAARLMLLPLGVGFWLWQNLCFSFQARLLAKSRHVIALFPVSFPEGTAAQKRVSFKSRDWQHSMKIDRGCLWGYDCRSVINKTCFKFLWHVMWIYITRATITIALVRFWNYLHRNYSLNSTPLTIINCSFRVPGFSDIYIFSVSL